MTLPWYNTSTKKLYHYCPNNDVTAYTVFYWALIEDQKAIDAHAAASQAQDTDRKRQVFVSSPYAPYDVGDLWLRAWTDSTGVSRKALYRCVTARASGFNTNDWAEATFYDNTQVTIDSGIITAGTVQLANGNSQSIVAGITGGESEAANETEGRKVRIWAGASKANRFTAPFRVLQDGSIVATKATIAGTVNATGEFGGMVKINGGMILLNKDGSGKLANGLIAWNKDGSGNIANNKIRWDSSGNVYLQDVSAISGNFSGLINAANGIRFGVVTTTASSYTMSTTACMIITRNTSSSNSRTTLNLPSSPNTGQLVTIKNLSTYREVQINGNGHGIMRKSDTEVESSIYLALGRVKQFVYDGSNWHQVGQYEY